MYRVKRSIGNNFVCSADADGREIILSGRGIGFQYKKGDIVPETAIERIYSMQKAENSNKLHRLIEEVPPEQIEFCVRLVDDLQQRIGKPLNELIYISLTDHISFAVQRKQQGLTYKNALLTEIQNFYPAEYRLGRYAVERLREEQGIELSEDEAGFIALHIINAEMDTGMSDMVKITEMIQTIVTTARNYYGIRLDESSLDYGRFIVHLRYLGQRICLKKTEEEADPDLLELMRLRYHRDFICACRIQKYVERHFQCLLNDSELIFLTVHLHRISQSSSETE